MKTGWFRNYWVAAAVALAAPAVTWGEDFARWVDPFIGTAATANCHPNACYPHGLVQAGPTSGTGEWKYCSGYQLEDTDLFGFVQKSSLSSFVQSPFSARLRDRDIAFSAPVIALFTATGTRGWPKSAAIRRCSGSGKIESG